LAAYRKGDLLEALAKYPADRQPASPTERIYLAALLLAVGQVERTEAVLNSPEISGAPGGRLQVLSDALRKLVAAVKLQLMTRLPTLNSPPIWLQRGWPNLTTSSRAGI
jgi:hypothetical protein